MELLPAFKFGWFNGWLLLVFLYLEMAVLLLTFPKYVVRRLYEYDRSNWTKKQRTFYFIGRFFILVLFALLIFSPLKIESNIFIPGIVLFVIGLIGFTIALLNFRDTDPGKLVTQGLYRFSRHPQVLMLFIIGLGICISIGSWFALLIQLLSSLFGRSRTLAEEQACLKHYGNSYKVYMNNVPRYLFIK